MVVGVVRRGEGRVVKGGEVRTTNGRKGSPLLVQNTPKLARARLSDASAAH